MEEQVPSHWSAKDINTALLTTTLSMMNFDNIYFQYQHGFLDEVYWAGARARLKDAMKNPISRANFKSGSRNSEFLKLIDEIVAEIERE